MEALNSGYSAGRGDVFLEDVESALQEAEDPGQPFPTDDEDDTASLLEAKTLAREKFDWLTSHRVVTQSRFHGPEFGGFHSGSFGRWPLASGCFSDEQQGLRARSGEGGSGAPGGAEIEGVTPQIDRRMATPGSYRSATQYLSACARYSLTPNGGALLCLSLGLDMLEVDGSLTNLELVPLCAALLEADFVRHLKLSGHPLQDTGAAVLALALPGCPWIKEIELVGCQITGVGVRPLSKALAKSNVHRLVLRGNLLRQNACMANTALQFAVERARHLVSLDLQSSGLSSQGMRMIKHAQSERLTLGWEPCVVDFEGNFVLVEVLNSVSHGICALICVEAWRKLNGLIIRLCHFESRMAVTLYIASMMAMFLGSSLYHGMFAVTELSWFFSLIDHCAIYFLIAGTYTPVFVMGCRNPQTMLVKHGAGLWATAYWGLVGIGIVAEHIFSIKKPSWYSKFVLSMYLLLGFGGVPYIASCPLVRSADVMIWIELGGLVYVVGIVFFLLDKRFPAMHIVWHLMVALGAFFHFIAVWNLTNEVIRDPNRSCTGEDLWSYALFSDSPPEPQVSVSPSFTTQAATSAAASR